MNEQEEELDLYLIWGIVGALTATLYRRLKARNSIKNIIINFKGTDIDIDKKYYYALVDLVLGLNPWDQTIKKDFNYRKNRFIGFLIKKLKVHDSNNYIKNIIMNRLTSFRIQKKYKKINVLASCNVPFVCHYYGGSYKKYIQIEHGSPIYRKLLKEKNDQSITTKFNSLKKLKYFFNLSRVINYEELFSIYSHQRSEGEQREVNKIYFDLIDEFFISYSKKYPDEFMELLTIRNRIDRRKTAILGPNSVGNHNERELFYDNIINIMNKKGMHYGLNKPHPDDKNNYQKNSRKYQNIIHFDFQINKNLPVEFLIYFFDCYGYIGAPTISAIYLSRIFNKSVIILNPKNNKKENNFEFSLINDYLSTKHNFEIIEQ